MERASRRRKRQRNHRRTASVIAALFLVFQLTVMPCPGAVAAQDSDDLSMDSGLSDLLEAEEPEEESEEEPEEEPEEELEEKSEEGPEGEQEEQPKEETEEGPDPKPEQKEEADEQNPKEENETASAEEEQEEESEDISEQERIPENAGEPGSDDPDELEEGDGDEAGEEEDDSEPADENAVFELTEETDDYTAVLCFDAGIPFPEGSTFTVSLLTEEEEAYPQYCRLLSAAAEAEEVLLGFYAFAWEIPEDVCSEEELFLTLTLKDEEYTEREYRAYAYEEDRFTPSENTEAEEDTFYITSAGQGLYALTAAECEQEELPPEEAGTDSLLMTDCLNSEEPEEAEDSNVTAEEKEAVIPAEEDTKEQVMEPPLKRMLIKNPAAAAGESEEEDLPLRAMSADTAVIRRDICRMHLSAVGLTDSEVDHVNIVIKDQNGDVRDTLTLSAENGWTADWETLDRGDASFTAEETGIFDSSGNDLSEEWNCSVQTSQQQHQCDPYSGWVPADGLEVGTYTIPYKIGGNESFLAAANPKQDSIKLGNYRGWMLTSESAVSDSSIWNVVRTDNHGSWVTNKALGDNAYLSAKYQKNNIFAVFSYNTEYFRVQYVNGFLKAVTTYSDAFLQANDGDIKCAETQDEATQITLYRSVTYQDTVYKSTVCFIHSQKPPPVQYTTVTVRLTVGGNMREWDRAFPFTAAMDDGYPVSFTLMHAGEFELEDIPIGAKLTVAMLAPDYEVTSVFGVETEGESSLTLSFVPEEGGTIVFQAIREWELRTGISPGRRNVHSLVLTVILSGLALYPFISVQIQHRRIPTNTRRKNRS